MKLGTFLLINFLVAGIADVTIYDLAHNFGIYSELKPYYKNKSILYAAFLSALIVTLAVFLLAVLSKLTLRFYVPSTAKEFLLYCLIAYPLGYILDKGIEVSGVFGKSLEPFYKVYGSGHSGAIAFIVSLAVAYGIQKYLVPLL